ncbi:winged helix-turn-helix transcriptional regulator [Patescibacteria group bacterium]|nr:winged helix-turn-helix transcriptional regulator [Patescibacteria group bacterium]
MIGTSYQRFFQTLANENRLKIIHFLQVHDARNVSEIVEGTNLEQTLVSHNLKRLHNCHFVEAKQNGKERIYSLNKTTIEPLLLLMDKHVNTYCVNCKADDHE